MTNVLIIAEALATFAKADAKAHDAGTSYMALAVADVWNAGDKAEDKASALIVDMCNVTGSVGKVTKEFPKGKPNPQALKANGYSGLAEAARLLRKVAKYRDNADVARVVEGFLGVIQNEAQFEAHKAEDKRVVKALESGDEAKLAKAEAAYLADYLSLTYPDRATSFSALRRQLDKATTAKGTEAEAEEGGEEGGEGKAELVAKADILAKSTIAELATALEAALKLSTDQERKDADAALRSVFVTIGSMATADAMAEEEARKAA